MREKQESSAAASRKPGPAGMGGARLERATSRQQPGCVRPRTV